jgi:hypothetical protein
MTALIQYNIQTSAISGFLLLSALGAAGQGTFQNLDFENTTLLPLLANPGSGLFITNATLPGWDWSPHGNAGYSDPNTTVTFDSIALDAPAITLHGIGDYYPALSGNYSVLLQGGSQFFPQQYGGASVFQTGQIPASAQTLIYLANGAIQVSFNGRSLSSVALGNGPNYTEWGVDIASCAGQSGELQFAVPWLGWSMLDGIEFSDSGVPEPSVLSLSLLGLVLVSVVTRWAKTARRSLPTELTRRSTE